MYLNLIELIYPVHDAEIVKTWISEAGLGCVLISTEQYGEEMLVVLANDQALVELHAKLRLCPAISSCEGKRRAVYRIVTRILPEWVLYSFPLGEGEEWYQGNGNTAYLCKECHQFSDEQIAWLATCRHIIRWEHSFNLS